MGLQDFTRTVRKRWRVLLSVLLVTVALAAGATLASPKTYAARSQVFVSVQLGDSTSDLVSGSTYAQSQVQSYIDVVTSPLVLQPVIEKLSLTDSVDDLARRVTVTVPDRTVLMDINATDADPRRAAAITNTVTDQFITTIATLESNATDRRSPVTITAIRRAQAPLLPATPNPVRNILLGLVLGLALGVGAALLREHFDSSIASESDLQAVSDLPIIGSIPMDSSATDRPLVTQEGHGNLRSEAFRSLRTNLQFVQTDSRRRSIVFTSSRPSEGKTTTVANLGVALAALGGRVCLVEADLRRPRLLDYLGLEGSVGVTNVLIGAAELDDVLQPFGGDGLWVIGAGPTPPNPSELLGSAAMADAVRSLESRFDFVIIDAPPLLPVTDAAVLTRVVGATIVVAGLGVVEREDLRRAMAILEQVDANTVGLVANMVPLRGDSRTYYGGYEPRPGADFPLSAASSEDTTPRRLSRQG